MPSPRIPKNLKSETYFLTFVIRKLYYIFDRHNRFNILADAMKYCQLNKGLKLYAFVFMLNHIHIIAKEPDMIAFVRDFKKYTSKQLFKNILETEPRVLKIFYNKNNTYEFWKPTNMPILIETEKFYLQKLNYIFENPVRKQYVAKSENWIWSSANPNCSI